MTETTKQIKSKPKIVKPNKFTRIVKNGCYVEKKEGYFWQETVITYKFDRDFKSWVKLSEVTTLRNVEDSPQHLKKSATVHVIFVKEEPNKSVWNGIEKSYWYLVLKYDIREADNLFLCESDGKLFLRDLHFGVTAPIALNESNSNYKCTQLGKIEKITAEQASAIVKETGTSLIFGRVEQDEKGEIKNFGTVV